MSKKNYEKSAGIALAFVLGVILIFTIKLDMNFDYLFRSSYMPV